MKNFKPTSKCISIIALTVKWLYGVIKIAFLLLVSAFLTLILV